MKKILLEEEILLRGYDKAPEIIIPTQPIIKLATLLEEFYLEQIQILPEKIKVATTSTTNFYESFFKLQRVPYYIEKKYGPFKIEKQGDIHPFALPITKEKDVDELFGSINEVILLDEHKKTIYYKSISLPKNTSALTKIAYTHEIAHSQLNHVKGIIKQFYNTEVISIFLELVHALELNDGEYLLSAHDSIRLTELKYIINELNKYYDRRTEQNVKQVLLEGSLYLQSTLQAYNLFITYYNSPLSIKKEILGYVQSLFNQEHTLEDVLSKLDISFENSINPERIKNYIRR